MLVTTKPDWPTLEERYAPLSDLAWDELEPEQQRERLHTNLEDYGYRNLKIRAKSGQLVPLKLNREQMFLHDIAQRQLEETGRVRIILLKGRQWGGSTYISGRGYWKATNRFGYRVAVMAHAQDATDELWTMVNRYHEHCHSELRPQTGTSNIKELRFAALDGGYECFTAGAKGVGRSKSFNYLHWSEVAQTPNADEHKAGLLQTLPEENDTECWLEGTAKGVGGTFHQHWLDTVEGKNDYLAVFIPWYWHNNYRSPVPQDFKRTDEEQELAELYDLDDHQLMWRRKKIATLKPSDGGNAEDLFKQEYPCSWQEAFLHSGRTVFRISDLVRAEKACAPGVRMRIDFDARRKRPVLHSDKKGPLEIWQQPQAGHRYVIGADTAEGAVTGDYSSAHVIDTLDGSTVAKWHGHVPADEYGDILCAMGYLYNKAEVAVEVNFSDAVLFRLQHRKYPAIFQREQLDTDTNRKQKKYGFLTTRKSKRSMIDFLDEDLRDGVEFRDIDLLKEMSTFVINDDQSMGASKGCHDDRVMSRAIASAVWRMHPKYRKNVRTGAASKVLTPAQARQAKIPTQASEILKQWENPVPRKSKFAREQKRKAEIKKAKEFGTTLPPALAKIVDDAVAEFLKNHRDGKTKDITPRRRTDPQLNRPWEDFDAPRPQRKPRKFGG